MSQGFAKNNSFLRVSSPEACEKEQSSHEQHQRRGQSSHRSFNGFLTPHVQMRQHLIFSVIFQFSLLFRPTPLCEFKHFIFT